jgi:hypothetical protein
MQAYRSLPAGRPRELVPAVAQPGTARIEYTVEVRRQAVRRAKEVRVSEVERTLASLENKGAYNFDVSLWGRP